jgi:hypothetical protein
MPESTLRWQSFNQKKPYFIATVFSMVAVIAAMGFLFEKLAGVKTDELQRVEKDVGPEETKEVKFKKAYGDLKKTQEEVAQVVGWMDDRYYWADVLSELRQVVMRAEQTTRNKLKTDAGVWIEQLVTAAPRPGGETIPGLEPGPGRAAPARPTSDAFNKRYGIQRPGLAPAPPPPAAAPAPAGGAAPGAGPARGKSKGDTNEIATLTLTFRAVSLRNVTGQADADKGIAYTVLQELQNSPLFDPDPLETRTDSEVMPDEQTGTFTFSLIARLKRPLKL